jgi:hypothetical protein
MNIQEAYRQLDLANGLDFDRVQSQYTSLKSGLAEKISGTSNAVLKEVYQKRLDEVEEAYTVLAEHFNHDVNDDVSSEDNGSSFTEDRYTISDTEVKASSKLNTKLIAIIGSGIVVLTALFFAFFGFQSKLDPFRTLEGEEQIFVSSLRLRKSPEINRENFINSYPTGTRFIYDPNEKAQFIDSILWRKIHICDTLYGWGTEEKPFLYSGWIATSECGVQYVADPVKTQQLLKIFEKDEKHFIIKASFRHALFDYFVENDFLGKWYVPDGNYDSTYTPVGKLNNLSDKYCIKDDESKDSPGDDLFVVIRSFEGMNQKILLMTVDSNGEAMVKREFHFPGENFYLKVDRNKNKVLLGRSSPRVVSRQREIYFDTYQYKLRLY